MTGDLEQQGEEAILSARGDLRSDVVKVRGIVATLQGNGDISDARAVEVLASAAEVEAAVHVITTTTTALPDGWSYDKHGHLRPPKGRKGGGPDGGD